MKQLLGVLGFAAAVWLVCAGFLLLMTMAAGAQPHDLQDPNHWYDRDCCDTRDCVPVDKTEFKPNGVTVFHTKKFGKVTVRPDKWGELARANRLRPSKDSGFHVCVVTFYGDGMGEGDEMGIGSGEKYVRCIYAPGGG